MRSPARRFAGGAPPYAIDRNCWSLGRSGDWRMAVAIAGTPPTTLTFSLTISLTASSTDQRRWKTSLPPLVMAFRRMARQPVTWKTGIETSMQATWGLAAIS